MGALGGAPPCMVETLMVPPPLRRLGRKRNRELAAWREPNSAFFPPLCSEGGCPAPLERMGAGEAWAQRPGM